VCTVTTLLNEALIIFIYEVFRGLGMLFGILLFCRDPGSIPGDNRFSESTGSGTGSTQPREYN
jgi:hypothetical protein